jgi:hypothetical protein
MRDDGGCEAAKRHAEDPSDDGKCGGFEQELGRDVTASRPERPAQSPLGLRSARPGHNRRGCLREPNGERPGHTPSAGTRAGCRRWRAAGTAHRCTARQRRAVQRSWWQHRDQHRHYRWRCSVTGRQHGPSHPTGPAGPTVSVVHGWTIAPVTRDLALVSPRFPLSRLRTAERCARPRFRPVGWT